MIPGNVLTWPKLMLVSFAGSTHSKYVTYSLETITTLELECSPDSKTYFLSNWVVNLKGLPGHHMERDLMQEHFNLIGEESLARDGNDFSDSYVSEVVGRMAAYHNAVKENMRANLGLKERGTNHPKPHQQLEIRTLLRTYKDFQLHRFRKGRCYSAELRDVDNYGGDIENLRKGKLNKWIRESSTAMGLSKLVNKHIDAVEEENEKENNEEDDELVLRGGRWCVVDSKLMFVTEEMDHALGDEDDSSHFY